MNKKSPLKMWNFNSSSTQKTDGSLMTLRTRRWVRKSRKHQGKTKSFCSTSYVSPDWFSVLKITLNTSELSLKPGKSSQQTKHQIQNKQKKNLFAYCFPGLENWNSLAQSVHCTITPTLEWPPFSRHRDHQSLKHTQGTRGAPGSHR